MDAARSTLANRAAALLLFAVVTSGAASHAPQLATEGVAMEDMQTAASGSRTFALELYQSLRGNEGNLCVSPFSLSTALAMTYAGARGETAEQMRRVLHLDPEPARLHPSMARLARTLQEQGNLEGNELHLANRLWGQVRQEFLPAFLEINQKLYGAPLERLDFARSAEARARINAWVEEQTSSRIQNLLPAGSVDASTALVLTNALYFKGLWAARFSEQATRPRPFHPGGGGQLQVPTMARTGEYPYLETEEVQVLEMPYRGNRLSMVLVLPRERGGLSAVEKRLDAATLEDWLDRLAKGRVAVRLPRFRVETGFELSRTLSDLGMPAAFGPGADFSGMTGARELFISLVFHRTFVAVAEQGTEAAGATAVVMKRGAVRPARFQADHPFLFLIRDAESGTILFLGRVANPAL